MPRIAAEERSGEMAMVDKKPKTKKKKHETNSIAESVAAAESTTTERPTTAGPTRNPKINKEKSFTPEDLESTIIAVPLLHEFEQGKGLSEVYDIIIDTNLEYLGGRDLARKLITNLIRDIIKEQGVDPHEQGIYGSKTELSEQYIFARLRGDLIQELVRRDRESRDMAGGRAGRRSQAIHQIWPDFEVERLTIKSVSTVKADAARNAFSAFGKDIVWAVLDSGIDADHPHFRRHQNLDLGSSLLHRDFTAIDDLEVEKLAAGREADDDVTTARIRESAAKARHDKFGHGTHVAGIIAGALSSKQREGQDEKLYRIVGQTNQRDEHNVVNRVEQEYPDISGMAPCCKLLSLKVLRDDGKGSASNLIAALEYIQKINGNGRRLLVHGVNMSVGYDFEPKWFACGQSPLCVEVDRLVRSGVVVVVAAGNTGYGWNQTAFRGAVAAGMDLTINDPGNAELAITVGSTHRDMPHVYGVSYFSSKGPTGDGRMKPDLVAPGEKIISCASSKQPYVAANDKPHPEAPAAQAPEPALEPGAPGIGAMAVADAIADAAPIADAAVDAQNATRAPGVVALYREDSGTSMAAPHVSGVIAAFLSVRREFIGRPDLVKQIFLDTATDLKRAPTFQGRGLIDLMRAIQSM
jgi:subtilisin family serine protease